jgi:hypothetical protein
MTLSNESIQPGTRVVGSDGDFVGRVDQVADTHVAVERDAMGQPTVYVPAEAIEGLDASGRTVKLAVPADEVDQRDWTDPPA